MDRARPLDAGKDDHRVHGRAQHHAGGRDAEHHDQEQPDESPLDAGEKRHGAQLLARDDALRITIPRSPAVIRRSWWQEWVEDADALTALSSSLLNQAAVRRIGKQLLHPKSGDILQQVRTIRSADGTAHLKRVAIPVDTCIGEDKFSAGAIGQAARGQFARRGAVGDQGLPADIVMGNSRRAEAAPKDRAALSRACDDGDGQKYQRYGDEGQRVVDDLAVPGRQGADTEVPHSPQGFDVLLHVAVGRIDDDRRTVDDVVAREQPVALGVQVAKVI